MGAGAGALRVEHQHLGAVRHQVDQQLELVDERRDQGLHALHRDALGELVGDLQQLGVLAAQLGGPAAHLLGQQQLAAGRRPEPVQRLDGALVGDGEGADLVDLVAEELHPDRVLLGRWEDVDDAAAHRELAALLDQVDAGVGGVDQPGDDLLEDGGRADPQLDRRQVAQTLDLRLEDRTHRRHHHLDRSRRGVVAGVAQAAQHGQTTADRVAARAEPLVRERLPARVVGDAGRVEQITELGDQLLGLPGGGGDREHRAPSAGQAGDQERPQRLGPGQLVRGEPTLDGVGHRGGEQRVGEDGVGEAGEAHRETPGAGLDSTTTPGRDRTGGGVPRLLRVADRAHAHSSSRHACRMVSLPPVCISARR